MMDQSYGHILLGIVNDSNFLKRIEIQGTSGYIKLWDTKQKESIIINTPSYGIVIKGNNNNDVIKLNALDGSFKIYNPNNTNSDVIIDSNKDKFIIKNLISFDRKNGQLVAKSIQAKEVSATDRIGTFYSASKTGYNHTTATCPVGKSRTGCSAIMTGTGSYRGTMEIGDKSCAGFGVGSIKVTAHCFTAFYYLTP